MRDDRQWRISYLGGWGLPGFWRARPGRRHPWGTANLWHPAARAPYASDSTHRPGAHRVAWRLLQSRPASDSSSPFHEGSVVLEAVLVELQRKGILAVMPAIRRAAELATPTCPPRWTRIGWPALAASSSWAVGSRPSRRWVSCQQ